MMQSLANATTGKEDCTAPYSAMQHWTAPYSVMQHWTAPYSVMQHWTAPYSDTHLQLHHTWTQPYSDTHHCTSPCFIQSFFYFTNSAVLIGAGGDVVGRQGKMQLVPPDWQWCKPGKRVHQSDVRTLTAPYYDDSSLTANTAP